MFDFLKHKNIYIGVSATLFVASILAVIFFGLNYGIDFKNGSVLSFEFQDNRPEIAQINEVINQMDISDASVRNIGEKGIEITFTNILSEKELQGLKPEQIDVKKAEKQEALKVLVNEKFKIVKESISFEEISPAVGERIINKTFWSLFLSIIIIIALVAISFRKISRPVSSWKYGIATIIALFHDVTIPIGIFAILGKYYGVQFTLQTVIALLTVFGYSVNDTIVIFDRIRENLIRKKADTFYDAINKSLNEVVARSLATSVATLLPLIALFVWGGETLKYFALALLLGIVLGSYSSIFLASSIVYIWARNKVEKIK